MNFDYYKELSYAIVGALYEVHNYLGSGLNEVCYQEALSVELALRHIPYDREVYFRASYKGQELEAKFRLDFLCQDEVIVELKSVSELNQNHRAQLFNYLRLAEKPVGILVNFAPATIQIERYLYDSRFNQLLSSDGTPLKSQFIH